LSALRNFGMLTPTFRFNEGPDVGYTQPREVTWLLVTHLYVPIIQHSRDIGSFQGTDFVEFPSSISGMKTFGYYTEYVHLVADTVWREMYRQPDRYPLFEENGTPCNQEDRERASGQWLDAMRSEQQQQPMTDESTSSTTIIETNEEETRIDLSSPDRGAARRRNGHVHQLPPPPPPPPPLSSGKKNKDE
jgi:hypothetical protein